MYARRIRVALLSLLLVAGLWSAVPAAAQDVRTIGTKVADILAQFPAPKAAERDRLAEEMLGLGEPGLDEFTRRLVPLGSGNDTAVRFAVNAMATVASRSGSDPKRALAERALVKALGAASDVEVRTFLLSQLRLVGRDTAVRAAAPHLASADLVEPATQLMLTVRSMAAKGALLAALDKAGGPARVTIVKALGELNVAAANPRLLAIAKKDDDPAIRKDVLAALARIGSPSSNAVLVAAAERAGFGYEPSNATASLLDYAKRLGERGAVVPAERICRLVMKNTDDTDRLPTRAAALAVLADVRGPAVLPDLLAAVDHADRAYRNAALQRAERLKGATATRAWVAKGQQVDAERRAEIILMLGRQESPAALPFIRTSLRASDPEVALAAAESLAHVEHAKAVPDLVAMLKTSTPETAGRVAAILGWTIDEKSLDPLVAELDALQPPARAATIRLVGDKNGKRFASRVMPLVSDPDPIVRAAAFKALAGVVGPADLPTLLPLLDRMPALQATGAPGDAPTVADVQKAVVAAASQVSPEDARAIPIVQALKTASNPERFIEVLPQVGGKPALDALVERFGGSEPGQKAAAFRGLVQWNGPEAADRLFEIFSAGDGAYRDMAFTGFLRQVSTSSLPPEQKVAQLSRAIPLATAARERRMLIRAFERAKTFQSFVVVSAFLDDPALANDAAGAVMRLALPTPGAKDGLSGAAVRRALEKVLQVLTGPESQYEKENVRTYLATMPQDGAPETGATPNTLTADERADGFVPLFNGRDMEGWTGNVAGYKVENGVMVYDPNSGNKTNVYSAKEYSDFVFRFEFQLTPAANSGVGIRAPREGDAAYVGMEIQVLDDTAPVYATLQPYQYHGSVYGVIPAKRGSLKPVGEWNSEEILVKGTKVRVTLNGTVIVDGDIVEASRGGTMDHKDHPGLQRRSGYIGWLSHGSVVRFRDIRIKELTQ